MAAGGGIAVGVLGVEVVSWKIRRSGTLLARSGARMLQPRAVKRSLATKLRIT
jgi:hypothetical protein